MKKILIISLCVFIFVFLLLALGFLYISQKTHRPYLYFPQIVAKNLHNSTLPNNLNFIILGVDKRDDWLEKTQTTDTIIFAQLNFQNSKLHLFSLPRDLWSYYTHSKINQIYPDSLNIKNDDEKFSYISQNFASISGQPINRVLVLSTENLKALADLLNGVDLYLEKGFIDKEYPNEDYINQPDSKVPIYKTVEFKSGWVHLDSSNIDEFVRSRKGADTAQEGGTDIGRIERQQLLINSLVDKLKNSLSKNPQIIFDLYQYWQTLEHNFTDTEIVSYILKNNYKLIDIQIIRHSLDTGDDPEKNLLYHPLKFINPQWVYLPQDPDYNSLHLFISQSLVSP